MIVDGKMITRLKLIFLLCDPLDVLEDCDNERSMLRKKCGLKICRGNVFERATTITKSGGNVKPQVVSRHVS